MFVVVVSGCTLANVNVAAHHFDIKLVTKLLRHQTETITLINSYYYFPTVFCVANIVYQWETVSRHTRWSFRHKKTKTTKMSRWSPP